MSPHSAKCHQTSEIRPGNSRRGGKSVDLRTNGQPGSEEMLLEFCDKEANTFHPHKPSRCCSSMTPLLVWISLFGVLSTVLLRAAVPIHLNVADEKFLEIRKCPACFGVTMCPAFLTGDIVLESWSRFTVSQLLNARNVFFARYKDERVRKLSCFASGYLT